MAIPNATRAATSNARSVGIVGWVRRPPAFAAPRRVSEYPPALHAQGNPWGAGARGPAGHPPLRPHVGYPSTRPHCTHRAIRGAGAPPARGAPTARDGGVV